MLVLSRKAGQSIQIGDNITITITRLGGNQVRVGIEAPLETPIRRSEIMTAPEPAAEARPAVETRPARIPAPPVELGTHLAPLAAYISRS